MKRGISMVMGYVIAAVLIIAFAGVYIFGILPRVERAPGIVERFLPEKCELTGKTRDEYLTSITELLTKKVPDLENARKAYVDMKTCFVDADIPDDLKRFVLAASKPQLIALANTATRQAFAEIIKIYSESRTFLPLEVWGTEELVIFARALFWYGKTGKPKSDDFKETAVLVDIALKPYKKPRTALQDAELQYLQIALSEDKARFRALINQLKSRTEPEFQLFVGLAQSKAEQDPTAALSEARKSPQRFFADTALFQLGTAYLARKDYQNAVAAYDAVAQARNSIFTSAIASRYQQIPATYRTYFNCEQLFEFGGTDLCICETDRDVLTFLPALECICQIPDVRKCERYSWNEQLCAADPCNFRRCRWLVSRTERGAVAFCATMP